MYSYFFIDAPIFLGRFRSPLKNLLLASVTLAMSMCSGPDQKRPAKDTKTDPAYSDLAAHLGSNINALSRRFGEPSAETMHYISDDRLLEGIDGFLIPIYIFRYGKWDVLVNRDRLVIGVIATDCNYWAFPDFNSRVIDQMSNRLKDTKVDTNSQPSYPQPANGKASPSSSGEPPMTR